MYNYSNRNKDRFERNTFLGIGATVGLFAAFSNKNIRQSVGQGIVKSIHYLGAFAESKSYSGTLQNISRGVAPLSSAARNLAVENNKLGQMFKSFDRLVAVDLTHQKARNTGIGELINRGWSSEDARLIFNQSNRSYDILSTRVENDILTQPYYRKHIIESLSENLRKDTTRLYSDVAAARHLAKEDRYPIIGAYEEASRVFANQLKSISQPNKIDKFAERFGINHLRLGSLVDDRFTKQVGLSIRDIHLHDQSQFSDSIAALLNKKELNRSEDLFARAAYHLTKAGEQDWLSIASNLPTNVVGVGDKAYNIEPIRNMVRAGFESFSNNFVIPISPGLGGLQPFKFFPWLRGRTKDFAGTFGAGTSQRELYEALPEKLRDGLFSTDRKLLKDLHYIGNKVFGVTGNEEFDQSLNKALGSMKWRPTDARFGLSSEFARIRNNPDFETAPMGNLRRWAGDSFLGRTLDTIGLDRQGEPSRPAKLTSVINKFLFPQSDKYSSNPYNAYLKVLAGSNEINDVENVIKGVRRHAVISNIDPRKIFTDEVMDTVGLPTRLRKFIDSGFTNESMAQALREIDSAMSGKTLRGAQYFTAQDSNLFKGLHTKINARRFAQNDIGTLAQGITKAADPPLFNLKGLVGEEDQITGFNKIRETFFEEIFHHVNKSERANRAFELMRLNVSTLDLPAKEQDSLMANIWAMYHEKYLGARYLTQGSRAEDIANIIRDETDDINGIIGQTLSKLHGGLTPWVNPNLDELEGVGAFTYAIPERRNIFLLMNDVRKEKFDPSKEDFTSYIKRIVTPFLNESDLNTGEAASLGPFYHSAIRLNQMLSEYGLGLPDADMQDTLSIYKNLFFKRVVPAFAGVEAWKYLNYESDRTVGATPDQGFGNIRAHSALVGSFISDKLGITPHSKAFVDLTPGLSDYWQPRSYNEQQDYLTDGYEPVRASRWWLGSRSPFVGGKVSYYLPSWYQLNQSGWQSADNVDLNNDDYWKFNYLPSFAHPTAPINRLLHPYHWEEKHFKDRPYVVSGPAFDEDTPWGNLANITIGKILKPQRIYHPEYLYGNNEYSGMGGSQLGVGSGGSQSNGNIGMGSNGSRIGSGELNNPSSLYVQGKRLQEQWWDVEGIYGWGTKQVWQALGRPEHIKGDIIQSPGRAYGYEKRFWDRNLGGTIVPGISVGGDLSELWRRVIPHKDRNENYFNPVPNDQPSWEPDSNYFAGSFREGDVFSRFKMGEVRLPGAAYEKIHSTEMVPVRASSLGGTVQDIANSILGYDNPKFSTYATRFGDEYHALLQKEWEKAGILESKEKRIFDRTNNISGHYDAILNINGTRSLVDIKTMGGEKFKDATGPIPEHIEQLNWYLNMTGIRQGKLYYVNRDDTTQTKIFDITANKKLYRHSIEKAREAKVLALNQAGSRGELYDHITRVEILGNIAPWSKEFSIAVNQTRKDINDEHDPAYKSYLHKRLSGAIERATEQKKQYNIRNYRFNQDTNTQVMTVKDIIDPNTISVEESDKPIKLAGVSLSTDRISKYIKRQNLNVQAGDSATRALYRSFGIEPGSKIKVVTDRDESRITPRDNHVKAAIYSNGKNINYSLLKAGVGTEVKDDSAPGIEARYNKSEKLYGRLVEKLAHSDTWLNTKFWNNRSALEHYKREQVYGTIAGDWNAPIATYLKPTMDAIASKNPIVATGLGALVGSFFDKSKSAKKIGAIIGASLGLEMSGRRVIREIITGEPYIPSRVEKRREVEEYYDTLKYIKYKRLEKQYERIGDAEKAAQFSNMAGRTLYGSNGGVPFNAFAGLPKYERELAMNIAEHGSSREKKEYYSLLTKRQKHALGYYLGIDKKKIPERELLQDYFKNHQLPDDTWAMWKEQNNLDDARIISGKEEGVTPIEMGVYPRNSMDAEIRTRNVPIPVIHGSTQDIQRTLHTLLTGQGITDISIDLSMSPSEGHSRSDINLNIEHDRTETIANNVL